VLDTCGPFLLNRVADDYGGGVERVPPGVAEHVSTDRWSSEVRQRDVAGVFYWILLAEVVLWTVAGAWYWRFCRRRRGRGKRVPQDDSRVDVI
jgi:hypothetical protein